MEHIKPKYFTYSERRHRHFDIKNYNIKRNNYKVLRDTVREYINTTKDNYTYRQIVIKTQLFIRILFKRRVKYTYVFLCFMSWLLLYTGIPNRLIKE